MRNVMDELPRDQHAQVRDVMRAAWKLTRRRRRHQETGRLSAVLEHEYESATQLARGDAGDVHDSKAEAAAVVIHMPRNNQRHQESAERGPETTGDVTRWRDAAIVERWVASAWVRTENHFPKVIGHEHL